MSSEKMKIITIRERNKTIKLNVEVIRRKLNKLYYEIIKAKY
jgi:hypothetical protein